MFLNSLSEDNKERFLTLCIHASLANHEFVEQEKDMIYAYCRELNIPEHIPEPKTEQKELFKELADNSTYAEKKIIVLETLALLKSDAVYDSHESDFMSELLKAFDISEEVFKTICTGLSEYEAVAEKLNNIICKE